ncbi:hypothetical protein Pelo_17195 [Pelomyxa schiedti]|nr:hypothetical protein Pelo_17195 [Pelomyxa schiedti]
MSASLRSAWDAPVATRGSPTPTTTTPTTTTTPSGGGGMRATVSLCGVSALPQNKASELRDLLQSVCETLLDVFGSCRDAAVPVAAKVRTLSRLEETAPALAQIVALCGEEAAVTASNLADQAGGSSPPEWRECAREALDALRDLRETEENELAPVFAAMRAASSSSSGGGGGGGGSGGGGAAAGTAEATRNAKIASLGMLKCMERVMQLMRCSDKGIILRFRGLCDIADKSLQCLIEAERANDKPLFQKALVSFTDVSVVLHNSFQRRVGVLADQPSKDKLSAAISKMRDTSQTILQRLQNKNNSNLDALMVDYLSAAHDALEASTHSPEFYAKFNISYLTDELDAALQKLQEAATFSSHADVLARAKELVDVSKLLFEGDAAVKMHQPMMNVLAAAKQCVQATNELDKVMAQSQLASCIAQVDILRAKAAPQTATKTKTVNASYEMMNAAKLLVTQGMAALTEQTKEGSS